MRFLWFYTVGAGPSVAAANKNALAELANRLQVNIQSTSQQFVDAQASGNEFYLALDVKQISKEFSFTRVERVKTSYEASNHTHYTLVKVDKLSFFADMHQALAAKLALFGEINATTKREQLTRLLQFNQQRQALFADLYLLQAYQQPVDALAEQIRALQKRFVDLAKRTNIYMINTSSTLTFAVSERLQKSGFLISNDEPLTSSSEPLKVVVSEVNTWQGQDQFHHSLKQQAQISFVYQQQLIFQLNLSAQAMAKELTQAQKRVWHRLIAQLGAL